MWKSGDLDSKGVKKVGLPKHLWLDPSENCQDVKMQVGATFFLNTYGVKFNLFFGNSHFG
jgi:hypothetical protein